MNRPNKPAILPVLMFALMLGVQGSFALPFLVRAQSPSAIPTPISGLTEQQKEAIEEQGEVIKASRELQKQLKLYREGDVKVRDYTEKLKPIEQQITTLTAQLELMDEQVRLTGYKIESVTEEIAQTKNDMAVTARELQEIRAKVKEQARILFEYVKLIYAHKKQYYDPNTRGLSELKLLLANNTLSKTIGAGQSLEIVERAGQKILRDLEIMGKELDEKETKLQGDEAQLLILQQDLVEQRTTLQASQGAKERLLRETKGNEEQYQKMIRQAQVQRNQSAKEVLGLQNDLSLLATAAAKLRATVSIDLKNLGDKGAEAAKALEAGEQQALFQWPVQPKRGLSASFNDAGYLEAFGVRHGAIDIPTAQGTLIQAPADAVVYKAKDNGFGFSYIILIHRNGFATLYGHLSSILVHDGDVIKRGGIIGLSGGAPGTLGAGLRTTGAHLHWEVIKDGKRVDPLRYVELEPVDSLIPTSLLPKVRGNLLEEE